MPKPVRKKDEEENSTIKEIKKDIKRIKRLRYLKMLLSLLLVSGVVVDLAYTYVVAKDVQIVDKKISKITPQGDLNFRAELVFTFENPRGREIDLEGITYKIYVEDHYLGEGSKGAFTIPPGHSNQSFDVDFNLRDLGDVLERVLGKEVLHLRIKGVVKVPARFFGLYTWKIIELPYDVTETFNVKGGSGVVSPVQLYPPTDVTSDSVTLSWSIYEGEGFSRYEVHYSTQPGFEISSSTLAGSVEEKNTTTYTVGNLQARTTYYFKIRVYTTTGDYADSNEVSATTRFLPIP